MQKVWPVSSHWTSVWGESKPAHCMLTSLLSHMSKKCVYILCVRPLASQLWHRPWHFTIFNFLGSLDSLLVECLTCDWKVASSNPGRSIGRTFFSRVNFVCWLLFGVRSTPLLLQWHVKDPSHSAKSAGGKLYLNTRTPLRLDPMKLEWADYAVVQAYCGNLSRNELTHNMSGAQANLHLKKEEKRLGGEWTVEHSPTVLTSEEEASIFIEPHKQKRVSIHLMLGLWPANCGTGLSVVVSLDAISVKLNMTVGRTYLFNWLPVSFYFTVTVVSYRQSKLTVVSLGKFSSCQVPAVYSHWILGVDLA